MSLDIVQIKAKLALLGNGAAISYWNGSLDINMLAPGLTNGSRVILASGDEITDELFQRANERLVTLRAVGRLPDR